MAWIIQPLEIADTGGKPTGRYRMTATSDEDGGGPFGDTSHDHATAEEAQECERCDEYVSGISGFPSRKRQAEMDEKRERDELARLKQKYEPPVVSEQECPGHVASATNPKVCGRCGVHIDELR